MVEKRKACKCFIYRLSVLGYGTQSRDRTGMEVNPLVFETSASTNSAIWAIAVQKYAFFRNLQTIIQLKTDKFEIKIILQEL